MPRSDHLALHASLHQLFGDKPFTARDAIAAGISQDRLNCIARAGLVPRLRRGTYAVTTDRLAPARERIRALEECGVTAVLGGRSAAEIWGIPTFGTSGPLPPTPLTLLVPIGTSPRRGTRSRLHLREAYVDPRDVVDIDGLPITSPLRTGIDVARAFGRCRTSALVPLSGGMRAEASRRAFPGQEPDVHEVTDALRDWRLRDELARDLRRMVAQVSPHGMRWIRQVLRDVEPLLESWLEAVAWSHITESDLPRPVPQCVVRGASGRCYRADFRIDKRVLLEVDGSTKYAIQTMWDEKRRQSDLEAAGYWIVRCTWEELRSEPSRLMARIRLAVRRSADI